MAMIHTDRPTRAELLQRFLGCDSGATAIEYGLIVGLTALAAIPALTTMGSKLSSTFEVVAAALDDQAPPAAGGLGGGGSPGAPPAGGQPGGPGGPGGRP